MIPPYVFVVFMSVLVLGMGGINPRSIANVVFMIAWILMPYVIALTAKKHLKDPKHNNVVLVGLTWLFLFLMIPVGEALYFIGIDL